MLNFKKVDIKELNKFSPYFKKRKTNICEISIGFIAMWHNYINIYYAIYNDTIVFKAEIGEGDLFSYPIGNDIDGMINELIIYVENNNIPLRFSGLNLDDIEYLNNIFKNNKYSYDFDFSDYIYSFSEASTFKGKKFSGQRNHINKLLNIKDNLNELKYYEMINLIWKVKFNEIPN